MLLGSVVHLSWALHRFTSATSACDALAAASRRSLLKSCRRRSSTRTSSSSSCNEASPGAQLNARRNDSAAPSTSPKFSNARARVACAGAQSGAPAAPTWGSRGAPAMGGESAGVRSLAAAGESAALEDAAGEGEDLQGW